MAHTVHAESFTTTVGTLVGDRWHPTTTPSGSVVLLHGGGQTRHSWRRTGIRLAEHGWEATAVDLRGHGDSTWANDGDYSIEAHAADVAQLARTFDTPPVLVGASLGGMASLLAQGADRTLARALVLVDITPRAEPAGLRRIHDFMRRGLSGFDSLDDALAAVTAYNPARKRPPRIDGLRKNLRERDGRWYWHWDPAIVAGRENSPDTADSRERRAREAAVGIDVPTLLIRGAQSDIVSDAGVRDLLDAIPGARHFDVAGAGHMVGGDDNDVLCHGLIDFLDTLPPH